MGGLTGSLLGGSTGDTETIEIERSFGDLRNRMMRLRGAHTMWKQDRHRK